MTSIEIMVVLSWIVILGLCLVVFALARQIGLLHERIKPVGALSLGQTISVGEPAPEFNEASLTGGRIQIGGVSRHGSTLLFFVSSNCPVCKTVVPIVKAMAERERHWLRLIFASDGPRSVHDAFIERFELSRFPYVLSEELGRRYQIAKLPYGVLLNSAGVVVSHGLINNREHLESLIDAYDQHAEPLGGSADVRQLAG